MAKRIIRTGTTADPTGDSLKNAFTKVNDNFTELYNALGLDADTLNIGAFEFSGSTMTTTDSSAITIDQATTITSDLTVGGDIVPSIANGGNLGSLAKPFKSLYVSNNTVFLGGVPLSLEPGTNELRVNNIPISQNISYTDIPNAPTDIADLTDDDGLLSSGTGDITFAATTMSAPDEDAIRIEAKDDNGDVRAYFKVDPADGQAEMRALGGRSSTNFSLADGDWVSAQWIANGGTGYLEFTNAPNIIAYFENTPSNQYIRINGGAPVSKGSGSQSDNDISMDTGSDFPPSTTVVTTVEFYYMDESRIEIDNDSGIDIYGDQLDISIESTESVYVQGRDVDISASGTLKLQNYADDQNIEIITDGDNEQQTWAFGVDGSLTLPGDHKVFTGSDSELILLSLSGLTLGKGDPIELTYDSSVAIGDDVVINTNISEDINPWTFGADGTTTFPNNTIDAGTNEIYIQSSNGASLVYTALDGNWESQPNQNQIAGLTASPYGVSVTLGRTADGDEGPTWSHEWLFDKDGSLTLPRGYIKNNTTDGFVRIEGPLFADMVAAGEGAYNTISNGVEIVTHGVGTDTERKFRFSWDGSLYMSTDSSNSQVGAIEWRLDDNIVAQVKSSPGGGNPSIPKGLQFLTYGGDTATTISSGFTNKWIFRSDGTLTIPGDIRSEGNINIDINLSDSTLRRWSFGEDGHLIFPGGTNIIESSANSLGIYSNNPTRTNGLEIFGNTETNLFNQSKVRIISNVGTVNRVWEFGTNGSLTLPAGGDIVNSTGVGQLANRVESSWTVTTGTNTYSFTVPMDGTYTMWVKCNIPNGILVWNATLSISNSNVPAIGTQYAWNYTGGGTPISLTSIPDQVKGVAGTISTDATYAGTTSNRFDFGISNTSGASQIVYYGYTRI